MADITGSELVARALKNEGAEAFFYIMGGPMGDVEAQAIEAGIRGIDVRHEQAAAMMAHAYSHLYGLPTTGLRYFTVYGPWGRPDMSPWLFTSAILEGRTIDVFNYGKMQRDFTYIDDIAEGTVRVLDHIARGNPEFTADLPDPGTSYAPYRVYNIGNNHPVELMTFIKIIEDSLDKKVKKNYLPMQPGDVVATYADVGDLKRDIGFEPKTQLSNGIAKWVAWYLGFHA